MTTYTGHLTVARTAGLPIFLRTVTARSGGTVSVRESASSGTSGTGRRRLEPIQPADSGGRQPPGVGARRRVHVMIRELGFVAAAALLYSLVRGLTDDRVDLAFANAERLISFEQRLGIFAEPRLQAWANGSELTVNLANAVYILYWPIIIGALLWLLAWRPAAYRFYRNALLASGAFSLVVFALYPLAPPRFLPEYGFVDTIAVHSEGYREFNASALVNEYAAMPSLHFGWMLLAGIAIYQLAEHRLARAVAVALPGLMLAAIVLTGNHYMMDAVVGGAVVLAGLGVASLVARYKTARPGRGQPAHGAMPAPS